MIRKPSLCNYAERKKLIPWENYIEEMKWIRKREGNSDFEWLILVTWNSEKTIYLNTYFLKRIITSESILTEYKI